MTRTDDVAAALAETRTRIADVCREAGRDPAEVTLIVVSKTHPASDVDILAELGVTDVGENRHPEAADKAAQTQAALRWHFLGGLQTNKAGAVARYADVVHSVDRIKLVNSLSRGAQAAERTLQCLIQVDFDATDPGRSGAVPAQIPELAEAIAAADALQLGGLMTVAPLGKNPRACFEELRDLSEALRGDHPEATIISAGMSGDFAEAIRAGATHLRIGRSILGARPSTG